MATRPRLFFFARGEISPHASRPRQGFTFLQIPPSGATEHAFTRVFHGAAEHIAWLL